MKGVILGVILGVLMWALIVLGFLWVMSENASAVTWNKAHASYYGPGLYGNGTACGQTLTASTQGVAHKTLPCGTRIRFLYRGRKTTVRVIDRGPFVAGRDFDLTIATRNRLRFPDLGIVQWRRVK